MATQLETGPDVGHADPVDGLVRTAVVSRSLDAVTDLIALLDRSPEGARTAVEALRVASVDRPVNEFTQLVALLSEPPHHPERADEAIRMAVEHRPIAEVSHLVGTLHQPPHGAHAGEEATRAAATHRSVEELVQLIGRLEDEREATAAPAPVFPAEESEPTAEELPGSAAEEGTQPVAAPEPEDREAPGAVLWGSSPAWFRWPAAAGLALCAVAHFPMRGNVASTYLYDVLVGLSALCLVLGVSLFVRNAIPGLVGGVLLPGAMTAAHLLHGVSGATGPLPALAGTSAPPSVAALTAGAAAVICGLVLVSSLRARAERTVVPARGSHREVVGALQR